MEGPLLPHLEADLEARKKAAEHAIWPPGNPFWEATSTLLHISLDAPDFWWGEDEELYDLGCGAEDDLWKLIEKFRDLAVAFEDVRRRHMPK